MYSATNDFTVRDPGHRSQDQHVVARDAARRSTFYTVTVAPDPTQAETAINTFVTAYNAAIVELNTDTVAPTVTAGTRLVDRRSTSRRRRGGGVLYGNYQVSGLRDQLVQLVSGFIPSGSTSYNSLQSVGIKLDTFAVSVGASTDATTRTIDRLIVQREQQLHGQRDERPLQALDTTTFEAAYAANHGRPEPVHARTALSGTRRALSRFRARPTGSRTSRDRSSRTRRVCRRS